MKGRVPVQSLAQHLAHSGVSVNVNCTKMNELYCAQQPRNSWGLCSLETVPCMCYKGV